MGCGKDGGGVINDHGETWAVGCSHYLWRWVTDDL